MKNFKFEFTEEETNVILNALANMPYAQVAGLVANIQNQAQPQVKEAQEETVTEVL